MIKSIIKVVIAVLLANALWHIAASYISFYKFQDAVQEYTIRAAGKSEDAIRSHVLELASQYEEPIDEESLGIRQTEQHLYVEATYKKPVAVLPGYEYQWPFSMKADGFMIERQR